MTPEHQQADREVRAAFEAWRKTMDNGYNALDAWLAALEWKAGERADVVPPGMVLVPIEPTRAMIDAGAMHTMRADEMEPYRARGEAIAAWSDMVAASQDSAKGGKP